VKKKKMMMIRPTTYPIKMVQNTAEGRRTRLSVTVELTTA
jgi:hypothetical protein